MTVCVLSRQFRDHRVEHRKALGRHGEAGAVDMDQAFLFEDP